MSDKEKVYVTRDEDSEWIFVWRKPSKGNWSPQDVGKADKCVNWQRPDRCLEGTQAYLAPDFKTKFGIGIRMKTKKCVHLLTRLLDSDDYQLFSNNKKRKQ